MNTQLKAMNENKANIERRVERAKGGGTTVTYLSLSTSLAGLTKPNLNQIRMNLGIQGASSLKKQELIDLLVQQIPEKLLNIFYTMDDSRFNIVQHFVERGWDELLLESHQLRYFSERAILFPSKHEGKAVIAMPQEVREAIEQLDSSIWQQNLKRNTEWIQLTLGMLYYFGTLSLSELEIKVEHYTGSKPERSELVPVLQDAAAYYEEIQSGSETYWNHLVTDPAWVQQEQQNRPELNYYPFTKEELLLAGETDFVDRTPIYRNFVNLIKGNYTISSEEADFIVEECVIAIRNGKNTSELFKMLQSEMELDEVELIKAVMEHSIMLNNHTRQWILKGYSPNLLSGRGRTHLQTSAVQSNVVQLSSTKKAGRNDPCPCGSGKKFKKCCIEKESIV